MLAHSEAVRRAYALHRLHGDRAEATAAQKATEENIAGDRDAADDWRRIRAVIRERRGPHQS
ncbi:MAG: hypothetical protein WBA25_08390 [Jannaschia sp.]